MAFMPTLWRPLTGKIKAIQSSNSEKKIDFLNPTFLSIDFNVTAPGAKNNVTTVPCAQLKLEIFE